MSPEMRLYTINGSIAFNSGDYIDDFCIIPGSSLEDVKKEYFARIEDMKKSPLARAMFNSPVASGEIFDIREVDISSYGYRITLEKIVGSNEPQ